MTTEGGAFDLRALFVAIDAERRRRAMSWAAIGREVGVAPSTIRRLADADDAEADGVLALVRWLGVAPEVFVVDATVVGEQLRPAGDGFVRVDLELVAEAAGESGGARGRTRTTIQRLAAVAWDAGRSVASLTRFSEAQTVAIRAFDRYTTNMCSSPVDVVDVVEARAQTARIVELCDQLQGLQAELTSELGDWLDTSWWSFDGARSPEEWLGLFGRLDAGDARRVVARSKLCEQLSEFAAAFAAGEITAAHLDVLARAVGERRVEHAVRDEAALLEAARLETIPAFERTVAGWRQHCDHDLAAEDAEAIWEGRRVHLRPDLFGSWQLTGTLDPDGGAALSAALAANRNDSDPAGGSPRSLGQRNADALVSLASGDSPIDVTVVIDHDLDSGERVAPRAEVEGLTIPAVTAERLTCGAAVSTVTRQGRSILDVTAATPTITVGQRRALLVRDPHCRFPGCTVIAARCDIHHLTHQIDGGQHRLDNLVHLCRHHHRFLHESRWTTTGMPDGELHFHPPPDREADHWLERTGIDTS